MQRHCKVAIDLALSICLDSERGNIGGMPHFQTLEGSQLPWQAHVQGLAGWRWGEKLHRVLALDLLPVALASSWSCPDIRVGTPSFNNVSMAEVLGWPLWISGCWEATGPSAGWGGL